MFPTTSSDNPLLLKNFTGELHANYWNLKGFSCGCIEGFLQVRFVESPMLEDIRLSTKRVAEYYYNGKSSIIKTSPEETQKWSQIYGFGFTIPASWELSPGESVFSQV
jgi:hypothetical protein